MDLKTIFILLVIVLALVLIALHVYEYYQLPKEFTLLQRDSLSHDQWKQLVKEKQPMIIRKGFSQDNYFHLIMGGICTVGVFFCGIKGLKTFLDAFFNKK